MSKPNPANELTPKHVRAARALLAWSQKELAGHAGVAISTVADFERGQRQPVANNAQAIRKALETAGIQFLPTGAVLGPTLPRIARAKRHGAPVRWVNSTDLEGWANRREGEAGLPTLLASLIRATHGPSIRLRFPSDEGIRHSGWDGRTTTDDASQYVPRGDAGWELGTQRRDIAGKARDDYKNRTSDPAPVDPAQSAFIFVTPRHWPAKDEWARQRQAEGPWREVRVYDADDLVHWIEQTPAVGQWLVTRVGKLPPTGTRQLEDVWEEWSLATQWPLPDDLILSDRDEDAAELLRWLRDEPSVFSIRATTTDEAVAFFHATLRMLPADASAYYRARCLVVTPAAARALADAQAPLILVLTEPDPGLARRLAERGHFVLQAYDDSPVSHGKVRTLARPSREGIAGVLAGIGVPEPRARSLARDSARNLAVLRRLLPTAPGGPPQWAEAPPPRALMGVLLAGAWDEQFESDKAVISSLVGTPYEQVVGELTPYVGDFDNPVRKVRSKWRVASPHDAWMLLAPYLSKSDLQRFEDVAHDVLGAPDPRYEMEPEERWMSEVHGVRPDYSEQLCHGVGEVLILLALWGDKVHTAPDARRCADAIVGRLLKGADAHRWWSLSRTFRLLAEASPVVFLQAIEDSLDRNDTPIASLFGEDGDGVFSAEHLSDLLWALESLAWSPELLPRVALALARLDAIDPGGNWSNRPANSLRQILLLWLPQTHASLDQRLRAVDLIRKREPDVAWKLMLALLLRGHDSSHNSPHPRWRDLSADNVEVVTWAVVQRGAVAISERLVADVGLDVGRWLELVERLEDVAPGRGAALDALERAEQQIDDHAERARFWSGIRKLLHHHRQLPDAGWSLPPEDLERIQAVYERLAPSDPLEGIGWLFDQSVALPNPSHEGWRGVERQVDEERRRAARTIFDYRGADGILSLARKVPAPGFIGKALVEAGLSEPELDALLEVSLRSDVCSERQVAHGLIVTVARTRGEPWGEAFISRARAEEWGDTALLTILWALPQRRWTWDQAASAGAEIEREYWRRVPVFRVGDDEDEAVFTIRKLIDVGRARHAVDLAGRDRQGRLPPELLVEVLLEAARRPIDSEEEIDDPTMFQHYVGEIFGKLDECSDIAADILVSLEWTYLPLFEHSRRSAKALMKALSEQPSFFIEVLSAIFKPSEDSGVEESEPVDPERAEVLAHRSHQLLHMWTRLPGTREDGTVDASVLESWIREARSLAKSVGREDFADHKIGEMLSASPTGVDGIWPAEAVRVAIELFRSKALIDGFVEGKRNRRGVTSRSPGDGGELEREEAAKYRRWAVAVAYEHPRTARALESLAEGYEDEARYHDEDDQRRDWAL